MTSHPDDFGHEDCDICEAAREEVVHAKCRERIATLEAEKADIIQANRVLKDEFEQIKVRAEQAEHELAALEAAAQDVAKFNWGTSVTAAQHFQRIDAMARLRTVLRGLDESNNTRTDD